MHRFARNDGTLILRALKHAAAPRTRGSARRLVVWRKRPVAGKPGARGQPGGGPPSARSASARPRRRCRIHRRLADPSSSTRALGSRTARLSPHFETCMAPSNDSQNDIIIDDIISRPNAASVAVRRGGIPAGRPGTSFPLPQPRPPKPLQIMRLVRLVLERHLACEPGERDVGLGAAEVLAARLWRRRRRRPCRRRRSARGGRRRNRCAGAAPRATGGSPPRSCGRQTGNRRRRRNRSRQRDRAGENRSASRAARSPSSQRPR